MSGLLRRCYQFRAIEVTVSLNTCKVVWWRLLIFCPWGNKMMATAISPDIMIVFVLDTIWYHIFERIRIMYSDWNYRPILEPSNMAVNCGLRRSWKPKVKPNRGCHINIAITVPYISVFVSSWYFNIWHSYSRLNAKVIRDIERHISTDLL